MVGDLLPCSGRVGSEVLHDAGETVCEFVVCGCEVEF